MNLKDEKTWKEWVDANTDPYGKACVDVARRVMEILDNGEDFDSYNLITQADEEIKAGGITGYMAHCVALMVSQCHKRGEEFRKQWNLHTQINNEGERANKKADVVLNPAVINFPWEN